MRIQIRSRIFPQWLIGILAICVAVAAGAGKQPPAQPLDLNHASAEELEQVPGIGPQTARAIVQFREKSGPFRRVEDLMAIRGITKKRLEQIRPYVFVGARSATSKT